MLDPGDGIQESQIHQIATAHFTGDRLTSPPKPSFHSVTRAAPATQESCRD
jgi:hypothetical protein